MKNFAIRVRVERDKKKVSDYQSGFVGTKKECLQKLHDNFLQWKSNNLGDNPRMVGDGECWMYDHSSGEVHAEYLAYAEGKVKNIVRLDKAFRHSYSQEFGWKDGKEHYMIMYWPVVNELAMRGGDYYNRRFSTIHVEYRSPENMYWLCPFSDDMDRAFERAGVELGYYSRAVVKELASRVIRAYFEIKQEECDWYSNITIVK